MNREDEKAIIERIETVRQERARVVGRSWMRLADEDWRIAFEEFSDQAMLDACEECDDRREAAEAERDRYREALAVVAEGAWIEGDPIAMRDFARAALRQSTATATDESQERTEEAT